MKNNEIPNIQLIKQGKNIFRRVKVLIFYMFLLNAKFGSKFTKWEKLIKTQFKTRKFTNTPKKSQSSA